MNFFKIVMINYWYILIYQISIRAIYYYYGAGVILDGTTSKPMDLRFKLSLITGGRASIVP